MVFIHASFPRRERVRPVEPYHYPSPADQSHPLLTELGGLSMRPKCWKRDVEGLADGMRMFLGILYRLESRETDFLKCGADENELAVTLKPSNLFQTFP